MKKDSFNTEMCNYNMCLVRNVLPRYLSFLPPANEVWGNVIFSQACVSHSVHRCVCMVKGCCEWGCGEGGVVKGGVCVVDSLWIQRQTLPPKPEADTRWIHRQTTPWTQRQTPPRPRGRRPLTQRHNSHDPEPDTPSPGRDGHWSGWYASHYNAFLLLSTLEPTKTCHQKECLENDWFHRFSQTQVWTLKL